MACRTNSRTDAEESAQTILCNECFGYLNSIRIKNSTTRRNLRRYLCFIGIIVSSHLYAQNKYPQLWTDFTINKALQNRFSFDCEFSYRTNLGNADKWRSLNITPKIEKAVGKHWDLLFYLGSIFTLQQQGDETWEIRPAFGVRYHFDPFRKLQVRVLGRFELRNQYNLEAESWSQDFRSRFRLEETYFINGESFVSNHLWYLLSDMEVFTTIDKELKERFSNRALLRIGAGYKLSDRWRYECIFTFQYSKNTIDGEYASEDEGILRLRFRYYIK